jgi:hypothetical protein
VPVHGRGALSSAACNRFESASVVCLATATREFILYLSCVWSFKAQPTATEPHAKAVPVGNHELIRVNSEVSAVLLPYRGLHWSDVNRARHMVVLLRAYLTAGAAATHSWQNMFSKVTQVSCRQVSMDGCRYALDRLYGRPWHPSMHSITDVLCSIVLQRNFVTTWLCCSTLDWKFPTTLTHCVFAAPFATTATWRCSPKPSLTDWQTFPCFLDTNLQHLANCTCMSTY